MSQNVLVGNLNYNASDFYTSLTYSTQITAAPATNVVDRIRRTKYWRSANNWEITSSTNQIVFQETIGVDITSAIAVATYATDATFFAAVKAAMEANGDSTYTVSRDTTTNKIKIVSNGSGGGGIFRLTTTSVDFTCAVTLGYSTAANHTGSLTYIADTLRIHTSEWLRWDLGTSVNPTLFALIGTRKDGLLLSSSAVVTLEGNATDVWTSPSYSQVLTWNARGMGLASEAGLHSSALRYWRMKIVDPSNPLGYIQVSSIFLGQHMDLEQGRAFFPMTPKFVDLSTTQISDWGQKFSDRRLLTTKIGLRFGFLNGTDAETMRDHIENYGNSYPFWICLDPNEVYSTDFQNYLFQVTFDESLPDVSLDKPDVFSSDWDLLEEV